MSNLLVSTLSVVLAFFFDDEGWQLAPLILLAGGFVFYASVFKRYRNTGARHSHETETKANFSNVQRYDQFVTHRKKLKRDVIENKNDTLIEGSLVKVDPSEDVSNLKELVSSFTRNI
jgi:hypothetical protein